MGIVCCEEMALAFIVSKTRVSTLPSRDQRLQSRNQRHIPIACRWGQPWKGGSVGAAGWGVFA